MTGTNFITFTGGRAPRACLFLIALAFAAASCFAANPIITERPHLPSGEGIAAGKRIPAGDAYIQSLQQSLVQATQWAATKTDDEALWTSMRLAMERILYSEWMEGRLQGNRPALAYFVRCDRTTMTQNDIDSGRAICLVGAAPRRPAEFVTFSIEQRTAGSP